MKFSLKTLLIILAFAFTGFAQNGRTVPPETQKGIDLYKQRKFSEAIVVLEQAIRQNKKDADAWNTLGLAYLENNDFKQARKALANAVKNNSQNPAYRVNLAYANLLANKLNAARGEAEKAIQLDPQNASAFYLRGTVNLRLGKLESAIADADSAIKIRSNHSSAYILKADGFLYSFNEAVSKGAKPAEKIDVLQKSLESLEACAKNCGNDSNIAILQERLTAVRAFHEYFSQRRDETIMPAAPPPFDPSVKPLTLTTKPRASYTDAARSAGITGTVKLAVLFSEDGKTKYFLVLKPLSNGLTEQSLAAARKIEFTPQQKNGKPVSVVKIVEYNFALY